MGNGHSHTYRQIFWSNNSSHTKQPQVKMNRNFQALFWFLSLAAIHEVNSSPQTQWFDKFMSLLGGSRSDSQAVKYPLVQERQDTYANHNYNPHSQLQSRTGEQVFYPKPVVAPSAGDDTGGCVCRCDCCPCCPSDSEAEFQYVDK